MRKGKVPSQDPPNQIAPSSFPVRPGYEKRYVVDPAQTESFAPVNSTNYHIALGAKATLVSKFKREKKDVRVRLRLRRERIDLLVKVPQEVKIHVSTEAARAAS